MKDYFYASIIPEVSHHVRSLISPRQVVLIGIDGCGGSGKSTFANELSEALDDAPIIRMDDFYKPAHERNHPAGFASIGWQYDWRRLETEVLQPLTCHGSAQYGRYNWETDRIEDTQMVHAESAAIVEGIFILRPELVSYYALRFWVECPKEIRLRRGIERDGEQARSQWEDDWMKEEEKYIDACHPQLLADKIMYGG